MEHPDEIAWRNKKDAESGRRISALNHQILSSLSPEAFATYVHGADSATRDREREFLMEMEQEILRGDPQRAIEQLDLDIRTRTQVPAAIWALRALAQVSLCHWSEAIDDADRAIMEDANFAAAHAIKAEGCLRQDDFSAALVLAGHALSLQPNEPRALGVRAAASFQYGLFEKAVEDADRALALAPKWSLPLEARALAYLKLGRPIEARLDAAVLLQSEPENVVAQHVLRTAGPGASRFLSYK